MTELFVLLVSDSLNEYAYAAELTGLDYNLESAIGTWYIFVLSHLINWSILSGYGVSRQRLQPQAIQPSRKNLAQDSKPKYQFREIRCP